MNSQNVKMQQHNIENLIKLKEINKYEIIGFLLKNLELKKIFGLLIFYICYSIYFIYPSNF